MDFQRKSFSNQAKLFLREPAGKRYGEHGIDAIWRVVAI
jgi:hypothetical protein